MSRIDLIENFYKDINEDIRLIKTRHGELEQYITMSYIYKFLKPKNKILELGAGTGAYCISLALNGYQTTGLELTQVNFDLLSVQAKEIPNLSVYKGDAIDLSQFADNTFDLTLNLGPMYHLFEKRDIEAAINETIRVTKPSGIMIFAYISVYGLMYANYIYGNWIGGQEENFSETGQIKHFTDQLFTGYDIQEFEALFKDKPVEYITTAGVDGPMEILEKIPGFNFSEKDFHKFKQWYLGVAEKRELLGCTNHLIYICKKK